ncbi:hypothetical protein HDU96_000103 [Phlyctochytrium bullatum]|nr:hypothetical protein HDU96_000103 [Phlyctochytrium bullatum]
MLASVLPQPLAHSSLFHDLQPPPTTVASPLHTTRPSLPLQAEPANTPSPSTLASQAPAVDTLSLLDLPYLCLRRILLHLDPITVHRVVTMVSHDASRHLQPIISNLTFARENVRRFQFGNRNMKNVKWNRLSVNFVAALFLEHELEVDWVCDHATAETMLLAAGDGRDPKDNDSPPQTPFELHSYQLAKSALLLAMQRTPQDFRSRLATSKQPSSPLDLAIYAGDHELVRLLLPCYGESQTPTNVCSAGWQDFLHSAIKRGNLPNLRWALGICEFEHFEEFHFSPLQVAAQHRQIEILDYFLHSNLAKSTIFAWDGITVTFDWLDSAMKAIHAAALADSPDCMRRLLVEPTLHEAWVAQGRLITALGFAVTLGCAGAVDALLEFAGSDDRVAVWTVHREKRELRKDEEKRAMFLKMEAWLDKTKVKVVKKKKKEDKGKGKAVE